MKSKEANTLDMLEIEVVTVWDLPSLFYKRWETILILTNMVLTMVS